MWWQNSKVNIYSWFCFKGFLLFGHFFLTKTLWGRYDYHPHLITEEIGAQRSKEYRARKCPKQDLKPSLWDPGAASSPLQSGRGELVRDVWGMWNQDQKQPRRQLALQLTRIGFAGPYGWLFICLHLEFPNLIPLIDINLT